MNMEEKYLYWLAGLSGLWSNERRKLLDFAGSAQALYRMPEESLGRIPGLTPRVRNILLSGKKSVSWESAYEGFRKGTVRLISMGNEEYPEKLKHIYNPPICLFAEGRLPDPAKPAVAVVGARECSAYGLTVAEQIGRELALRGVWVISGLAYGIDAASQRGTLEAGGFTCGVLASGVDVCYPSRNRRLYEAMKTQGGLVSENMMGTQPLPELFPLRNRIISGLSDAVIVVEAKRRSGSLITADFALEQGKNVYAVPGRVGDVQSEGCNWLIRQGAFLFCSVEEVCKDLKISCASGGWEQKNFLEFTLEKKERLVYSVLDLTPMHLEAIMETTSLDLKSVTASLFRLEEWGLVKEIYRNHYIKVAGNG